MDSCLFGTVFESLMIAYLPLYFRGFLMAAWAATDIVWK